ncbi:MAG: hypothetical protein IJ143_06960 [Neisseriaceae bacterium]|nr:hypothetical protein [Neisseriaceae bacterium]
MKDENFKELNNEHNYLALAAAGFTVIRNLAYGRGDPRLVMGLNATERIERAGQLAQALHCIPTHIGDDTALARKLVQQDLYTFLTYHPQYYSTLCHSFRLPKQMVKDIQNRLK